MLEVGEEAQRRPAAPAPAERSRSRQPPEDLAPLELPQPSAATESVSPVPHEPACLPVSDQKDTEPGQPAAVVRAHVGHTVRFAASTDISEIIQSEEAEEGPGTPGSTPEIGKPAPEGEEPVMENAEDKHIVDCEGLWYNENDEDLELLAELDIMRNLSVREGLALEDETFRSTVQAYTMRLVLRAVRKETRAQTPLNLLFSFALGPTNTELWSSLKSRRSKRARTWAPSQDVVNLDSVDGLLRLQLYGATPGAFPCPGESGQEKAVSVLARVGSLQKRSLAGVMVQHASEDQWQFQWGGPCLVCNRAVSPDGKRLGPGSRQGSRQISGNASQFFRQMSKESSFSTFSVNSNGFCTHPRTVPEMLFPVSDNDRTLTLELEAGKVSTNDSKSFTTVDTVGWLEVPFLQSRPNMWLRKRERMYGSEVGQLDYAICFQPGVTEATAAEADDALEWYEVGDSQSITDCFESQDLEDYKPEDVNFLEESLDRGARRQNLEAVQEHEGDRSLRLHWEDAEQPWAADQPVEEMAAPEESPLEGACSEPEQLTEGQAPEEETEALEPKEPPVTGSTCRVEEDTAPEEGPAEVAVGPVSPRPLAPCPEKDASPQNVEVVVSNQESGEGSECLSSSSPLSDEGRQRVSPPGASIGIRSAGSSFWALTSEDGSTSLSSSFSGFRSPRTEAGAALRRPWWAMPSVQSWGRPFLSDVPRSPSRYLGSESVSPRSPRRAQPSS